jgi:thioredoxin reductase (NADPH)
LADRYVNETALGGNAVDASDLFATAFPRLGPDELESLRRCPLTRTVDYGDGQRLFSAGECNIKFFVVQSGGVEILDESADPPRTVAMHGVGEFVGDVSQLSGSQALVSGVVRGASVISELTPEAFKELLNHHPALGDMIIQAFLARREILRQSGRFTGLRVLGSRFSHDTYRVRDFLAKNRVPFNWQDLEADPQAATLLRSLGLAEADTPVVVWGRNPPLRNPPNRELAERLGLRQLAEAAVYDLVVVGAGPAGLAAAVYGASEGLKTIVLEQTATGGQAGRSMRIDNYLGFPTGITGSELAERALLQASRYGAQVPVGTSVTRLTFDTVYNVVRLEGSETVTGKCLLIATGAEYRRLDVADCDRFEGCGVYYAATPMEAQACRNAEVVVVGGGNSAGQAVFFLLNHASRIYLVVRGDDLSKGMSSYLSQRIQSSPNVEVMLNTVVGRLAGDGQLSAVELVNRKTGSSRTVRTPAVFSFIGASPRTEWLPDEVQRDAKGFVRTGPAVTPTAAWTPNRPPYLLETSRPGVFAAGDVRAQSVKRVASAVGEGAMAVQFVHEYLRQM